MSFSQIIYALILVSIGYLVASASSRALLAFIEKRFTIKNAIIFKRLIFYLILAIFLVMALHQLGFNLSVLLGAAGILSVAIGFASQTSMSNVISGLFLLGERAFSVGDTIKIGNTTGEVISVDWLSIKLRTPENMFVRIPNETLIKSEMTNLTRFKIRRFDLNISIAYSEDIGQVRDLLLKLVNEDTQCLDDPEPLVIVDAFADSGITLRLAVWAKSEEFLKFRSRISEKVKAMLDKEGIEIPYPHISLYAGEHSAPIRVQLESSSAELPVEAAKASDGPQKS